MRPARSLATAEPLPLRRSAALLAAALLLLAACDISGAPAEGAAPPAERGVSLTVYSSADPAGFDPRQHVDRERQGTSPQSAAQVPGYAVVRDLRTLDLAGGLETVAFTDVPQFLDPTTVSLVDVSGADRPVEVVEQQLQFDLVSPEKLLDAYLDREISVRVPEGDGVERVTGTLLSANQGRLVLDTADGLRMVGAYHGISLGELPEGLLTRPTLVWRLWSPEPGPRRVRTAYQAAGITWRADYNLVLDEEETHADLGAWVTLLNLSGASYRNARLKLMAGDVHRAPRYYGFSTVDEVRVKDMAAIGEPPAPFEEKSFFEYHMYTLPRPVTLHQNAAQQLALFPTRTGVDVEKVLVYYGLPSHFRSWAANGFSSDRDLGTDSNPKVDVYLRLDNEEENGLGLPLPAGKMRVYQADSTGDGALELVGEDVVDHTPQGRQVLITLGQSFDVTGERVRTDYRSDLDQRWAEETVRITVFNAKQAPQEVLIRETLFRCSNWEIVTASREHEKIDSRTIHFPVTVPAEGEATVLYTVRYTW